MRETAQTGFGGANGRADIGMQCRADATQGPQTANRMNWYAFFRLRPKAGGQRRRLARTGQFNDVQRCFGQDPNPIDDVRGQGDDREEDLRAAIIS